MIINSTITPNMTFTKTSQKFGQWADSRANTVFGLGFASEQQLAKVRGNVAAVWNHELRDHLFMYLSLKLECAQFIYWISDGEMKQSEKGFKGLILKSSLSLDNWLQDLPEHFKVSHAGCDISACITTNHHISLSLVFFSFLRSSRRWKKQPS